jgi:predicted SPOUT superfamily RNA methylase MTH1
MMMPNRRLVKISIALPSSLVSEIPHIREKTNLIGQIARNAVIHRIEDIYIYRDNPDETRFIQLILSYLETPQYLRKNLFKVMNELRYVGILPPLRTPHHPIKKRSSLLEVGEFREGIVLSRNESESLVNVGTETPIKVIGYGPSRARGPSVGSRVSIMVTKKHPYLMGRFTKKKDIETYWGYNVHVTNSLSKLASKSDFDITLATSRHAPKFKEIMSDFTSRLANAKNILIAFGSPKEGLKDILVKENAKVGDIFNFSANMIPDQGSMTVRTEEALSATLALIGMLC